MLEEIQRVWWGFISIDSPHIREKLVEIGILDIILTFLNAQPLETVQLHFIESLKPFFTFGGHQKKMVSMGILEKLIDFVAVESITPPSTLHRTC